MLQFEIYFFHFLYYLYLFGIINFKQYYFFKNYNRNLVNLIKKFNYFMINIIG
jgi:hypothetical protein